MFKAAELILQNRWPDPTSKHPHIDDINIIYAINIAFQNFLEYGLLRLAGASTLVVLHYGRVTFFYSWPSVNRWCGMRRSVG